MSYGQPVSHYQGRLPQGQPRRGSSTTYNSVLSAVRATPHSGFAD